MSKFALPVFAALVLAFLLAPIVVVVISSFNAVGVLSFPPRAFTTRWHGQIDPSFVQSFQVSLEVAAIATAIAVVAGVPAALSLARGSFPGRNVLQRSLPVAPHGAGARDRGSPVPVFARGLGHSTSHGGRDHLRWCSGISPLPSRS